MWPGLIRYSVQSVVSCVCDIYVQYDRTALTMAIQMGNADMAKLLSTTGARKSNASVWFTSDWILSLDVCHLAVRR